MTKLLQYSTPFQPVAQTLDELLPDFDHQAVEVLLATVVANWLPGPVPVWLEMIAPASVGKTTILEPLEGIKAGWLCSDLTSRTLLSGSRGQDGEDPSLLAKLGKHPFIIIKELSTLLSSDKSNDNNDIFRQLREVFDGFYQRSTGNNVHRVWRGKATVVAGITPAVDKFGNFAALLGERFMKLRFNSKVDPEKLALAAMRRSGSEDTLKNELNKAYKYCIHEGIKNLKNVQLSEETELALAALSTFAAQTRTIVDRNQYMGGRIEDIPAPEGTPRIAKNLKMLAVGLCAIYNTTKLDSHMLSAVQRVAWDCMPEPRRSILKRIVSYNLKGTNPQPKDLNGIVSESYVYVVLEELEALNIIYPLQEKVLNEEKKMGRPPKLYAITELTHGWATRGKLIEM